MLLGLYTSVMDVSLELVEPISRFTLHKIACPKILFVTKGHPPEKVWEFPGDNRGAGVDRPVDVPFSNTIIVYYDKSITRLPRADDHGLNEARLAL